MLQLKKTDISMKKHSSLSIRSIFRYLMENRYYPIYENTHLLFELDGNMAVLELDEDIVILRVFFSIEENDHDKLLEASNSCMTRTYMVKAALLDDMKNIMFSCETLCSSSGDFARHFPKMTELIKEAIGIHKDEMKHLLLTEEILKATMPVTEDPATGIGRKLLS